MANAVRTVSRAAIYCRGGSHKAQGRLCKEEILAHENWTLADTYADVEIPDSQMRGSRTAFNRMLEDCRKGKLDKIVTMSVSRFARNLSVGLTILRELSAMGVTVHFVMESIDTESFLAQAVRE